MRLYTRTKRRLAANRLAGTIAGKYQKKQTTRTAGTLGHGLSMIDGQLYDTGSTNGAGSVAVVNLGRPAAAIYAPQTGGQITLGGGSGGALLHRVVDRRARDRRFAQRRLRPGAAPVAAVLREPADR